MIDQRRHQPVYSPLSLRLRVQWRVGLLLAALLLCAGVLHAQTVQAIRTCTNPARLGMSASSCTGGTLVDVDSDDLGPDVLVAGCYVASTSGSGCASSMAEWHYAGELGPLDLVYSTDAAWYVPTYFASGYPVLARPLAVFESALVGAYGLGEGGGGGGEGGGDISEADLSEAGTWFASAFLLVVMLWGMGKGIGLIVGLVRGR